MLFHSQQNYVSYNLFKITSNESPVFDKNTSKFYQGRSYDLKQKYIYCNMITTCYLTYLGRGHWTKN